MTSDVLSRTFFCIELQFYFYSKSFSQKSKTISPQLDNNNNHFNMSSLEKSLNLITYDDVKVQILDANGDPLKLAGYSDPTKSKEDQDRNGYICFVEYDEEIKIAVFCSEEAVRLRPFFNGSLKNDGYFHVDKGKRSIFERSTVHKGKWTAKAESSPDFSQFVRQKDSVDNGMVRLEFERPKKAQPIRYTVVTHGNKVTGVTSSYRDAMPEASSGRMTFVDISKQSRVFSDSAPRESTGRATCMDLSEYRKSFLEPVAMDLSKFTRGHVPVGVVPHNARVSGETPLKKVIGVTNDGSDNSDVEYARGLPRGGHILGVINHRGGESDETYEEGSRCAKTLPKYEETTIVHGAESEQTFSPVADSFEEDPSRRFSLNIRFIRDAEMEAKRKQAIDNEILQIQEKREEELKRKREMEDYAAKRWKENNNNNNVTTLQWDAERLDMMEAEIRKRVENELKASYEYQVKKRIEDEMKKAMEEERSRAIASQQSVIPDGKPPTAKELAYMIIDG
jgi:hypothetical protein